MKKILTTIIFLLIAVNTIAAEPDTIDVWHVYYNKNKIKEFNEYNKGKIILKVKEFKVGDKIFVKHFDDTPCEDCEIFLFVETEKSKIKISTTGEGKPLPIDVMTLIALSKNTKSTINVYYSGSYRGKRNEKKLLFEIEVV